MVKTMIVKREKVVKAADALKVVVPGLPVAVVLGLANDAARLGGETLSRA